jgi:hypothetical protein
VVDNQTYYQDYINEVKPYRTKIREYLIDYTGNDTYEGSVTDFDLPAYYDTSTGYGIFRSPSGEVPYVEVDEATWQTFPYNQWYANRNLVVSSILLESAGANYQTPPTVTISSVDGNGSGATATAVIDGNTGAILSITLTNEGFGYTTTPSVTINGSSTTRANAYAVMKSPFARSFDTKMKFDRISYNSTVQRWAANTTYAVGQIVSYAFQDGNVMIRKAYSVNSNITTASTFIPSDYTEYFANAFSNANDRIVGFYEPTDIMPAIDVINVPVTLANTAANTDTIYVFNAPALLPGMYITSNGVEAGYIANIVSNVVLMVNSRGTINANLANNSTSISGIIGNIHPSIESSPEVGEYVSGVGIPFETTIINNSWFANSLNLSNPATVTANAIPISYGGIPIKVTQIKLTVNVTLNTDATITANYDNLSPLIDGIDYPKLPVQGADFSLSPLYGRRYDVASYDAVQYSSDGLALLSTRSVDVAMYSLYSQLSLGTAPEDIITDGGSYVDTNHSHAPEELVPGRTYDTLDMRIFTKIDGNANVVAYRIFDNMMDETSYLRISSAASTTLEQSLRLTDSEIFVADVTPLPTPNPTYARPGVVFINGERITYYTKTVYSPVAWTANTSYPIGTAISNNGTNYRTTGNVNAPDDFGNASVQANVSILLGLNVLGQLRRGTQGTSAYIEHAVGELIIDGSNAQVIPGSYSSTGNAYVFANVLYNSGSGTALDGTGLTGSITPGALFLKANTAPVTGVAQALTTEDAINTLTTESNIEIYTEDI